MACGERGAGAQHILVDDLRGTLKPDKLGRLHAAFPLPLSCESVLD